ncbi:MAG TPA: RNA-directed DNA polymerase, partial [Clostridia bacterium]|nr:RNA-directed DNA polymerase [Clostridia bacterium]
MSKSERLKSLLGSGYFPEELPPPFTTVDFAKFRTSIGNVWSVLPNSYPKSIPERYSVPRPNGSRRELAIVNPIAEYHVSKLIADNWVEIRKHLRSGSYSIEPVEIVSGDARAVPKPDFGLVALRRAEVAALHDYILVADISRFYGTLYTHAVPWALHGKAWAKANLNTAAFRNCIGDKLDVAVRKGNDNQTIGIPVGPDSSRIVSEIVAVAIDTKVRAKVGADTASSLRHVDDWYIGFDTAGHSEDAISAISAACRDYELELNFDKTKAVASGTIVEPVWPAAIRQMPMSHRVSDQRKQLDHFFLQSFSYADQFGNESVLDFAIKRSKGFRILPENWRLYETNLLKAARANSTTLPSVVQILTSYNANGYPLDKDRVAKLVRDVIQKSAPTARHAEIAWALFLAKALRIALRSDWVAPVSDLESSVCALLLLDLNSRGLVSGAID